jgi:hypothetical protein
MTHRVCPSCGVIHESPRYAGCCSRGCMRFHQRRSRPVPKRPTKLARELVAAIIAAPPPLPPAEPPPPQVDMIVCDVCQKPSPDWATFEIGACKVCCSCRPEFLARKKERDDRARPGCPSMGGGVRVIRSTKGLS